jgi:hypothetical protein
MNPLIQLKTASSPLVALALLGFALLPGAQAVVPPPDGGYPNFTTAEGQNALFSLTTGAANTAVGWYSLFSETTGSFNTATGTGALLFNTADQNTAFGAAALLFNTTGFQNTAVGTAALLNNTASEQNTASGAQALLSNSTGHDNTANGANALVNNTTGNDNVALGALAGTQQTTGSNNVYIGFNMQGTAGESNTCYINSIFGQTSPSGIPVLINSSNKLGTMTSSKRFKEDIKQMDKTSEALLELKPVTFRYKKEIDPEARQQFGLLAEEVEKVNPNLVVRDKEGKPYSVRYDQVNAMLLNEFLKEHNAFVEEQREVEQQQKEIDALKTELKEQRVLIEKVNDKMELKGSASQTTANNQ